MNEPNVPHATITCNPSSPTWEDPLKAAQLHNFALRLDLRRVRRDLLSSHKIVTVNRLLGVNAAVARSLEWLNSKTDATHGDVAELEKLAMTSVALPDEAEVVAQ